MLREILWPIKDDGLWRTRRKGIRIIEDNKSRNTAKGVSKRTKNESR